MHYGKEHYYLANNDQKFIHNNYVLENLFQSFEQKVNDLVRIISKNDNILKEEPIMYNSYLRFYSETLGKIKDYFNENLQTYTNEIKGIKPMSRNKYLKKKFDNKDKYLYDEEKDNESSISLDDNELLLEDYDEEDNAFNDNIDDSNKGKKENFIDINFNEIRNEDNNSHFNSDIEMEDNIKETINKNINQINNNSSTLDNKKQDNEYSGMEIENEKGL